MSTEEHLQKKREAAEKREHDAKVRQVEFDRLYEQADKAIHEKSPSVVNQWLEVQAKLQSEYDKLPSTRAHLAKERRQEFDKIFAETQALIDAKHDTVSTERVFSAKLESRLEHLHDGHKPSSRTRPNATVGAKLGGAKMNLDKLFAEAEALVHPKKHATSHWAQSLMDTRAEMESKLEHLHDGHQQPSKLRGSRVLAKTSNHLDAKKDAISSWAQGLTESQAEMQSKLEHLHDGHKQPSKLRGSRVLAKTGGTVDATADATMSLKWDPVKSWKEKAPHRYGGAKTTTTLKAVPVTRDQLRHVKWDGKIPKVSCIMAVPTNRSAQIHFKYAMNNFKLQHYEGEVELVVVYHNEDEVAARLVHEYAEEGRIRGVAARGNTEVPSTMALRYGAWTSKADVIAQWDFEAWHHPDQLSMQVRAMAMSGRPGSLVMDREPLDKIQAGAHIDVLEGSLIGEAAWMREHWHPLLNEERGLMETYQSHNMALVDAPALAIDHHHTPAMNTSSSAPPAIDVPDALESIGIEACRSIIAEARPQGRSMEPMVSVEVGANAEPMPERFQANANVAYAVRKVFDELKALCKAADDKMDPKERSFMHHHAGTMETLRKQMDVHVYLDGDSGQA